MNLIYQDRRNEVFYHHDGQLSFRVEGERVFMCQPLDIENISVHGELKVQIETYSGPYIWLELPDDGQSQLLLQAIDAAGKNL